MSHNQIKINRRLEPAYRRQARINADLADLKTDLYYLPLVDDRWFRQVGIEDQRS